jgi:hypothetical protein
MTRADLEALEALGRQGFSAATHRVEATVDGSIVTSGSVAALWAELGDPKTLTDVSLSYIELTPGNEKHLRVWIDKRSAVLSVTGHDEAWVLGRAEQLSKQLKRHQYKHWSLVLTAHRLMTWFLLLSAGGFLGAAAGGRLLRPIPWPVIAAWCGLMVTYVYLNWTLHRMRPSVVRRDARASSADRSTLRWTVAGVLIAAIALIVTLIKN